jgi:hypothetical protein
MFLTSALVRGEGSSSRPGRFTPGERAPSTHWIGGWVDLRVGLDDLEKTKFLTLPGLELRPLGRTARSLSLYRLRYVIMYVYKITPDRLCGLVIRVPGYRSRDPGLDFRRYQIF